MQQTSEPRASRLISEVDHLAESISMGAELDPFDDERRTSPLLPFDDEDQFEEDADSYQRTPFDLDEALSGADRFANTDEHGEMPLPIASDLVLLTRAVDNGTLDPDVSPFLLELAKASRAYADNIELRIVAAGDVRLSKEARDFRQAQILADGVKPINIKIDGKTAEIREAQLAVLCAADPVYSAAAWRTSNAECNLEAATLRADACRELSRSIRAIILALTAQPSTTEDAN